MSSALSQQASSPAAELQNIRALDASFMMKVFYVFAVLALLSLAISLGGKWFGRSIALAGHADDATPREIVIMAPLVILTILFGIYPAPILDVTAKSVNQLVERHDAAVKKARAESASRVVVNPAAPMR